MFESNRLTMDWTLETLEMVGKEASICGYVARKFNYLSHDCLSFMFISHDIYEKVNLYHSHLSLIFHVYLHDIHEKEHKRSITGTQEFNDDVINDLDIKNQVSERRKRYLRQLNERALFYLMSFRRGNF